MTSSGAASERAHDVLLGRSARATTIELGALHATTIEWVDEAGLTRQTIVAKTTYALEPGTSPVIEPLALNETDNHWNDDPARSLHASCDLVPCKPSAEVTLIGRAFAPKDEPVCSVIVRLIVGEVDKAIEVVGDRYVSPDGEISAVIPFQHMPLRYERAGGGAETRNPVGVCGDRDGLGRMPLPNLKAPTFKDERADEHFPPIGFGPMPSTWPDRLDRLVGNPFLRWLAAPEDQRLSELRRDERIVLENLHPGHPRLVTNLESLSVVAYVERPKSAPIELPMVPDSLWIDTDRALCTLTWRVVVPTDLRAHHVVVSTQSASGVPYSGVRGPSAPQSSDETACDSIVEPVERVSPLPFVPGFSPLAVPRPEKESDGRTGRLGPSTTLEFAVGGLGLDTLPFGRIPEARRVSGAEEEEPAWRREKPSPWSLGPEHAAAEAISPTALAVSSPPLPTEEPVAEAASPAKTAEAVAPAKPVIELLWHDHFSAARVRKQYAAMLEELPVEPDEVEENQEVLDMLDILVQSSPRDEAAILAAMDSAKNDRGRFRPPIVLVQGTLAMRFPPIEMLRAMIELASPFASTDKRIRETLDEAKRVADTSKIETSPSVERATNDVEKAISSIGRQETLDGLKTLAERSLVEGRRYQTRTLFGSEQLRCFVVLPSSNPIPAYLPASIHHSLPHFAELPVRLVAEAHLPQEQSDAASLSLRVLALGRLARKQLSSLS